MALVRRDKTAQRLYQWQVERRCYDQCVAGGYTGPPWFEDLSADYARYRNKKV